MEEELITKEKPKENRNTKEESDDDISPIYFSYDRLKTSSRQKMKKDLPKKNQITTKREELSEFKKSENLAKYEDSIFRQEFFDFESESDNDQIKLKEIENDENEAKKLCFVKSNAFNTVNLTKSFFTLKSFLNLDQHQAIMDAQNLNKTYTCKFCGELFKSGCAMGGHISKIHSGLTKKKKIVKNNKADKKFQIRKVKVINLFENSDLLKE